MYKKYINLFFIFIIVFIAGGIIFHDLTPKQSKIKDDDVLVVLTGGKGRIATGVEILKKYPNTKLFISGVGASQIADVVGNPELLQRVDYEQNAKTTRENSFEVADWAERTSINRFVLITSQYHMNRSLLLLHRQMPNIEIIPYAIGEFNLSRPRFFQLWVSEYLKYIHAFIFYHRVEK